MTTLTNPQNTPTKSRSSVEREDSVKRYVLEKGSRLKDVPAEFRNDQSVVKLAVLNDGSALQYASLRLRSSPDFACKLLKEVEDSSSFKYFMEDVQNDISVVSVFLTKFSQQYWKLPSLARDNKDVVRMAVGRHPDNFRWCSEELRDDTEFVREMARRTSSIFAYASDRLRNDPDFVLSLITGKTTSEISVVKYASDELKSDPSFAIKVMQFNPRALGFLDKKARENNQITEILINKSPDDIHLLAETELFNPKTLLRFFKKEPIVTFQHLQFNETSKAHPEIVRNLVVLLSRSPKDCATTFNRLAKSNISDTDLGNEQQSEFYSKNAKVFDWIMPFLTDAFLSQRTGVKNSFLLKAIENEIFRRSVQGLELTKTSKNPNVTGRKRKIKP